MVYYKRHIYYVYIITNDRRTVLYTGVSNNLEARIPEHYYNRGKHSTFTGKYNCYNLIYYERFTYIKDAIARKKQIKKYSRKKKEQLINSINAGLEFLNKKVCFVWPPRENPSRY